MMMCSTAVASRRTKQSLGHTQAAATWTHAQLQHRETAIFSFCLHRPPLPRPVDAVPLPCTSLAAIAAEANNPSQAGCVRNAGRSVSHTLAATDRTHFLQLLLATGLLPAVDKTATAFTILAPADAAVEAAAAAGAFRYGDLFATNKTLLKQIIGYHVSSGQALKQPTPQSADKLAPTLMKGDAGCGAGVAPSWRADGLVRGGRGVARVGEPIEGEG